MEHLTLCGSKVAALVGIFQIGMAAGFSTTKFSYFHYEWSKNVAKETLLISDRSLINSP